MKPSGDRRQPCSFLAAPPPGTPPNTAGNGGGAPSPRKPKAPLPPAFHLRQDGPTPARPLRAAGTRTRPRQRRRSGDGLTTTSSKMLCSCVSMGTMGIAMGPAGPAGPYVRRRRRRPRLPVPPAGSSAPDPAPREAAARPGRSGRRRPPREEGNSILKFRSRFVLFFFLQKHSPRLLWFLNNLFFE